MYKITGSDSLCYTSPNSLVHRKDIMKTEKGNREFSSSH